MNIITAWDVSSTRTGFAVVGPGRKVHTVGSWSRNDKLNRGQNLLDFYRFVLNIITHYPSAFACMEQQPVLRGMRTTDLLAGYRNLVYMAYEGGINQPLNEIQQTQRFKALGIKRVTKKAGERTAHQARKINKAAIMRAVQVRFNVKLGPKQEDEADALAIAEVLYQELERSGQLALLMEKAPASIN